MRISICEEGPFEHGTWLTFAGGHRDAQMRHDPEEVSNKEKDLTNKEVTNQEVTNQEVINKEVTKESNVANGIEDTIAVLQEQVRQLRSEVQHLKKNVGSVGPTSSTNIIGNHNNNFITQNIVLADLGGEDLAHLTKEQRMEWLLQMRPGFLAFMRDLHFNPQRPENRNFRILSKNKKLAILRRNGGWQRRGLTETIHTALDKTRAQFMQPLSEPATVENLIENHGHVMDWCQKVMAKHQTEWRPLVSNVRDEMEKVYDCDLQQQAVALL